MMKQIEERRNRMLARWYDSGSDYHDATRAHVDACTDRKCRGECGAFYDDVRREARAIRASVLRDPARLPTESDGERRA